MFVDRVSIEVTAGSGGAGAEAFRRERGVPHGGPSGGDGGDGGDVVLLADDQLDTLLDYRYRSQYQAERGRHGEGKDRTGRSGEDLVLRVPAGTVVRDEETGEWLGELLEAGERLVVARGGQGGKGTGRRATATRQAPTGWDPGEEGEHRRLEFELKLIADVGLVGEPNAGKSTFLSAISAARPKIGDYPFTTRTPTLGVVELPGYRTMVVADIPGIIDGAHEGRGLGFQFLRHVERTRTLAFLIPVDDPDPEETLGKLREELRSFSAELAEKPHCLILTKADLLGPDENAPRVPSHQAGEVRAVSAVARSGLDEALEVLWQGLETARDSHAFADDDADEDGGQEGARPSEVPNAGEGPDRRQEAGPAQWPDEWEEGWTDDL